MPGLNWFRDRESRELRSSVDATRPARFMSDRLTRSVGALALTSFALRCAHGQIVPAASPASSPYIWHPVRIVGGGEMPGLYSHPTQPGLMYIRANVGGAYRDRSRRHLPGRQPAVQPRRQRSVRPAGRQAPSASSVTIPHTHGAAHTSNCKGKDSQRTYRSAGSG